MRVFFDYPLATEENMKAIQDAINSGTDIFELYEMFDEEMLWDCVVVLSGNTDTPWALLDHMEGNLQTVIEDWQFDIIKNYVAKSRASQSLSKAREGVEKWMLLSTCNRELTPIQMFDTCEEAQAAMKAEFIDAVGTEDYTEVLTANGASDCEDWSLGDFDAWISNIDCVDWHICPIEL